MQKAQGGVALSPTIRWHQLIMAAGEFVIMSIFILWLTEVTFHGVVFGVACVGVTRLAPH